MTSYSFINILASCCSAGPANVIPEEQKDVENLSAFWYLRQLKLSDSSITSGVDGPKLRIGAQ